MANVVGQKAYNINVFSFSIQNSLTPIIESVRTPARITPYPTGRLFGVALFQALRARLRSHRPSGTFRNRLSLQELGIVVWARILQRSGSGKPRPTLVWCLCAR